ncbi:L-rhamnose mutarotase [Thalassotalea sp. HSM 43]|uniref:L-rhamnose mutarotase n=1 Tax=Thalassotalea sp. HSM 43 TaxID=2552945 RepID=UPI0010807B7D|nr:L-rhamnose mutarotase [Thalassotalea sp. HSM 43]QBY03562.1 L-rhamnose mutarotase [Thalassotalea sp. HSM 43]
MTTRYCFALDLKDDSALIAEYRKYHSPEGVWPEIIDSIKDSGIEALDIYLVGNRLFMIMDVNDSFSFEAKQQADLSNPKVVEWEQLMWVFQQQLPWAKGDEKWLLMDKIFNL